MSKTKRTKKVKNTPPAPVSDFIEFEGLVTDALPSAKFKILVQMGDIQRTIIGYASGKMQLHNINILVGDKVTVEVSPYNLDLGRITYRFKNVRV